MAFPDFTDQRISDCDEDAHDARVKACAAHLADLQRVYGKPPAKVQSPTRAHEGRLRAERKIGELRKKMSKAPGRPKKNSPDRPDNFKKAGRPRRKVEVGPSDFNTKQKALTDAGITKQPAFKNSISPGPAGFPNRGMLGVAGQPSCKEKAPVRAPPCVVSFAVALLI